MTDADSRDGLLKELAEVRRRGIYRIESPNPRLVGLEFPILRQIASVHSDTDKSFTQQIEQLIRDAIDRLPAGLAKATAETLFGLNVDITNPKPDTWRGNVASSYLMGIEAFRKGPELDALGLVAVEVEALIRSPRTVIQPNAEDLLLERSTFHVVRTLEARRLHLDPLALGVLDDILARFRDWHLTGSGDAGPLLTELSWLCERYFDRTLYDLAGSIRVGARGPEYPPQSQLPWCKYPGPSSVTFVPGGIDPFTGESVDPFYMAVFPVTAYEWYDFLRKFNWQASDAWAASFSRYDLEERKSNVGRLPALGMTYYDCIAYCFWLWGTTPYRFRLPTEAEWNFAATGGKHLRYPWGNNASNKLGWFSTTSPGVQSPIHVDVMPPAGPHHLVGLAGNVWEYTSSLWRDNQPISGSDVAVPDLPFALGHAGWWEADERIPRRLQPVDWREEVKLVMKGGSWGGGPEYATMDSRIYSSFYNSGAYGGFRLAVSAVPSNSRNKGYGLEPSPLIRSNLQQVRLVSSADFTPDQEQGLTLFGCGGSLSPREIEMDADATASWDAVLRERHG